MALFIDKLRAYENQVALAFDDKQYSYGQLIENVELLCQSSELNQIDSGSVVALVGDYSFESICLFLALSLKKCVVVPVVSNNQEEVSKRLEAVSVDVVINLKEQVPAFFIYNDSAKAQHTLISQIVNKGHSGLVLFSSGSTGLPKAMVHDLDNLLETYLDKRAKSLSIMVFLMFDHIGGLNTLLNSLSMGAKIVIPGIREPEYVSRLIEREKVNLLPASPSFLNMMLIAGVHKLYNLKSLRMVTYGTEAMPESLLARLKAELPRVKLLQTFGTSETGIVQTTSRSSSSLEIKFDDPNQEYKIVDNELWLRSKTQILGYLNHDMSSFTDDGWFQTGDLVEQSADGYLKIIGRAKEVINVGGEKVLPSEVESTVLEVEGVQDCVAYAASNNITGQTVVVRVSIADSFSPKDIKKAIRKHCRKHLDNYKVPTKVLFSEDTGVNARFKKIRVSRYDCN